MPPPSTSPAAPAESREKYCFFIISADDIVEPPQSSEIQ
jgi:coatomer subunit beta